MNWRDSWRSPLVQWAAFGLLLLAAAGVVWLGPEERTLGEGIRAVYVHVGFIWTGTAAFGLAALLGMWLVVTGSERVRSWVQVVSRVGLILYIIGVGLSTLASQVNWGAVFWQEPRMQTAVILIVIALLTQFLFLWLPLRRWRGLLDAGYFVLLIWANNSTRLVLHPGDAIGASEATGIRLTFWAVAALIGLTVTWLTWRWHQRRGER